MFTHYPSLLSPEKKKFKEKAGYHITMQQALVKVSICVTLTSLDLFRAHSLIGQATQHQDGTAIGYTSASAEATAGICHRIINFFWDTFLPSCKTAI